MANPQTPRLTIYQGGKMSGGSYDYLCYVDSTEIENRLSDVERMAEQLVSLGCPNEAKAFCRFIEQVKLMRIKKSAFIEEYQDVMRGVEWTDSGDWSEESFSQFMEEREKELLSTPQGKAGDARK